MTKLLDAHQLTSTFIFYCHLNVQNSYLFPSSWRESLEQFSSGFRIFLMLSCIIELIGSNLFLRIMWMMNSRFPRKWLSVTPSDPWCFLLVRIFTHSVKSSQLGKVLLKAVSLFQTWITCRFLICLTIFILLKTQNERNIYSSKTKRFIHHTPVVSWIFLMNKST